MSNKLVYGVGINDADYIVHEYAYVDGVYKMVWRCPFYRVWGSMLGRSYSKKFKARCPTYEGVSTVEQWHRFSTFRIWMLTQDWEGNQLDKDLLYRGNKEYGPETCTFVSGQVNGFVTDSAAARGEYLIGVSWHKAASKFSVSCSNPFTGKREYLGLYNDELSAHQVWKVRKLELARELAATQTDGRVAQALIERYTNTENKDAS